MNPCLFKKRLIQGHPGGLDADCVTEMPVTLVMDLCFMSPRALSPRLS